MFIIILIIIIIITGFPKADESLDSESSILQGALKELIYMCVYMYIHT